MEGGEAGGGGEAPPPTDSAPEGTKTLRPSEAAMNKPPPVASKPPPTKMEALKANCRSCCHFLYNRDEGTVMGRGARRWAFLILFYILFYLTILGFFLAYLGVIMSSIDNKLPTKYWRPDSERPYWDGSRLQKSPAVIFYPSSDRKMNPESALIWITKDNYKYWATKVHEQIEGYKKKGTSKFPLPVFGSGNDSCNNDDKAYGYSKGQPTFLVRITKMLKWEPKPFPSANALEKYLDKELKGSFVAAQKKFIVDQYTNKGGNKELLIICEGETIYDSQSIVDITYCGGIGIPTNLYPYPGGSDYLPPFIAIQFKDAIPGTVIAVECFPLAANIDPIKNKGHGREKFEFMIDL